MRLSWQPAWHCCVAAGVPARLSLRVAAPWCCLVAELCVVLHTRHVAHGSQCLVASGVVSTSAIAGCWSETGPVTNLKLSKWQATCVRGLLSLVVVSRCLCLYLVLPLV